MNRIIPSFALALVLGSVNLTAQTSQKMEDLFKSMTNRDAAIEEYCRANKLFNVQATPEGIYYIVEQEGVGAKPAAGQYVKVHYTGTLLNGNKFDSSKDRNQPFMFMLGQGKVIQGWDKGIPLFAPGGKGKLLLPASLAYGNRAMGNSIPANSPLIFDIEVLSAMTTAEYQAEQAAENERRQKEAAAKEAAQVQIERKVIDEYAAKHGLTIKSTPSGLCYVIDQQGDGPKVEPGKTAIVHYTGTLTDGTKFDSSRDRNQPFPVTVGQNRVIKGWEEGLTLFNKGGKGTLLIPSTLGYGAYGAGGVIPANAVIIFDIEIVDVK